LYQNLVRSVYPDAPDSVHLTDFPVADESKIDKELSDSTRLAMKISSLGRAARSKAGIKVRQPLAVGFVSISSAREQRSLARVKPQILEELNIKDMQPADDVGKLESTGYVISSEGGYSVAIPTVIPPELEAEGMAREIVHRLQTMRRSAGFDIADYIVTYYQGDDYIRRVVTDFAGYIQQETLSRQLVDGMPKEGVYTESYRLSSHQILLGIKKETS
jgi:isoleucyl-tRNA synthetase